MRASDLIGRTITLPDGTERVVVGIRAIQDGPPRGLMAAIRVDSLIVSNRHAGSYLGFQDRDQQGPWVLGRIVRWLHRGTAVVPWEDVREQVLPPSG